MQFMEAYIKDKVIKKSKEKNYKRQGVGYSGREYRTHTENF